MDDERTQARRSGPERAPQISTLTDMGRGSFVSGEPEGDRLRVAYFRRRSDGHLVGRAWFGPGAEGPPGHAHGGSMAAVLDEAMGAAAWLQGKAVLAVHLEIDFQAMLPLGTDAWLDAWVEEVDGRKVRCRGRVHAADGSDHCTAAGLFLTMPEERFHDLLDRVAAAMDLTPEELREHMRERGWEG